MHLEHQPAILCVPKFLPVLPALLNTMIKESFIDLLIFVSCQQPHKYLGPGIIITFTNEFFIISEYIHYIAICQAFFHFLHLVIEYPWMPVINPGGYLPA